MSFFKLVASTAFCAFLCMAAGHANEPHSILDFSGVDEFWQIQGTLASGREPTRKSWDRLFATPGYALLEERERRRSALEEAFRLAYLPEPQGRPAQAGQRKEWVAYVLPHLRTVPEVRAQLDAFREKLEQGPFLQSAVKTAQDYLPEGTTTRLAPPPISFIFFAPDGRGYPRLLLDLLHLMQTAERSEGFLAHELFHSYASRIGRKPSREVEDELLLAALGNAEDEGIADQLDKSDIPAMTREKMDATFPDPVQRSYYESYQREYVRSAHWLQFAEAQLEDYARNPSQRRAIGEKLHGELPDNGRVLGAFMASTIASELGRNALVATVGNPIEYWRTYHRAAVTSGGKARPLSGLAMRALDSLEHFYYDPP